DEPGSGGRGRVEEADRVVLARVRIVAPVRHPAELASPVAQRTALARCDTDRASIRGAQLDDDRVVPGIPDLELVGRRVACRDLPANAVLVPGVQRDECVGAVAV